MSEDLHRMSLYYTRNNDIKNIQLLLMNPKYNPSYESNCIIRMASEYGGFHIIKLLLKDPRVDPSDCDNYAIQLAFKNRFVEIVNLLWTNECVKNTLKNHDLKLYQTLINNDTKQKLKTF